MLNWPVELSPIFNDFTCIIIRQRRFSSGEQLKLYIKQEWDNSTCKKIGLLSVNNKEQMEQNGVCDPFLCAIFA